MSAGLSMVARTVGGMPRRWQVGAVAVAVAVGALAGTHPVLVLLAVSAGLFGLVVITRPDWATLAAVALLYSNAAVIAHRIHGLPKVVSHASAALLLIVLLHHLLLHRERLVLPPALPWIAGFFVVQVIGALGASDPLTALESVQDFLTSGLLLFVAFSNAIRTQAVLRRSIWVLLVVGALIGALSLHQSVTQRFDEDYLGFAQVKEETLERRALAVFDPGEEVIQPRLAGPIGEKNYYAQIMIALVPLGLLLGLGSRFRRGRVGPLLLTALIAIGATLTFSRGGAVGLVLTLLAMMAVRSLQIRHVALILVGITLILLFFPRYLERITTIVSSTAGVVEGAPAGDVDEATLGRLGANVAGLRLYAQRPVVGVGPGMFNWHYREQAIEAGYKVHEGDREAHSLIPHIAAETGTLGLIFFFGAIAVTLRDLLRVRRRMEEREPELTALATGAMFAIVAYVTTGMFLSLAYQRYFWFLLALGAAAAAIADRTIAAPDVAETAGSRPRARADGVTMQ